MLQVPPFEKHRCPVLLLVPVELSVDGLVAVQAFVVFLELFFSQHLSILPTFRMQHWHMWPIKATIKASWRLVRLTRHMAILWYTSLKDAKLTHVAQKANKFIHSSGFDFA